MLDMQKIGEEIVSSKKRAALAAQRRWGALGKLVESQYKKQGRTVSDSTLANIYQACDNLVEMSLARAANSPMGLNESTQSNAIAFAQQMLPTIPALLPALAAEHVSVVQALDRPSGEVYYANWKAGITKGNVTKGDQLVGAKIGHNRSEGAVFYATDYVLGEAIGVGDGSTLSFAHTAAKKPIVPNTVKIVTNVGGNSVLIIDNGNGGLVSGVSGLLGTSTIDYTTGAIALVFASGNAPTNLANITLQSYRIDVEMDPTSIGEMDLEVIADTVTSQKFPLKIKYTSFAAINLQKLHGMVLADEGAKFATQEIRFAIDQLILKKCLEASLGTGSAESPGNFDGSTGAGKQWTLVKDEFKKYLAKGSMNVFQKTLRSQANVIVAGANVCVLLSLLEGYKSSVKEGTKAPSGPYVHGQMGQYLVICNPFYENVNQYVMLFRGENILFAGLGFFPYVPLYATAAVELSDFSNQQGFFSQAGFKVIFEGMFTQGTISGV